MSNPRQTPAAPRHPEVPSAQTSAAPQQPSHDEPAASQSSGRPAPEQSPHPELWPAPGQPLDAEPVFPASYPDAPTSSEPSSYSAQLGSSEQPSDGERRSDPARSQPRPSEQVLDAEPWPAPGQAPRPEWAGHAGPPPHSDQQPYPQPQPYPGQMPYAGQQPYPDHAPYAGQQPYPGAGYSTAVPGLPYRPPPPKPAVPADLDTARTLWVVSAVLGVASIVCAVVGMDRAAMAQHLYEQFNRSYPSAAKLTLSQAGMYVWVELVLVVVFDIGFWALALLFVRRMRGGRLWARNLLTVLALFQVVKGVDTLFGVGHLHSGVELASGAMSILQAVLAAGAIYLMFRPESNSYFQKHQQLFRR